MKRLAALLAALVPAVMLTLLPDWAPSRSAPTASATGIPPSPGAPPAAMLPDQTAAGPATPAQLANGARTYRALCAACHLPDGRGMAGVIPPLAGADYMLTDRERAVRTVLHGLTGPITVNGVAYNNVMPPLDAVLNDQQAADVLTYVFNTWGNAGDAFSPGFVATVRARGR